MSVSVSKPNTRAKVGARARVAAREALEVVIDAGFRLADPAAPGRLPGRPRWKATNRTLAVVGAAVELVRVDGSVERLGVTDRGGRLSARPLADGSWTLRVEPAAHQRSSGPATAMAGQQHWLARARLGAAPTTLFEAEYRPLTLVVEIAGGQVKAARVEASGSARPVPAAVFWEGVGATKGHPTLHIDWRPDYLRRGLQDVRPGPKQRNAKIDLIFVHQTGGASIGGPLNTFLRPKCPSGAHFLNDVDGHLVRLADDVCVTVHAGGYLHSRGPVFAGTNVNHRAIGIENVHKGAGPFNAAQYTTLIDLIRALREVHGVPLHHVVGHQDATPKAGCPGRGFDWPRLEAAGVALAPLEVTADEVETMFGGLFAGAAGKARVLRVDDVERRRTAGIAVVRGEKDIAEGLTESAIEAIAAALKTLGYAPQQPIKQAGGNIKHESGRFDKPLAFCLAQFIRHYATGTRYRGDQKVYGEIDLTRKESHNRVRFDLALARLLRGAELAVGATATPLTRRPAS